MNIEGELDDLMERAVHQAFAAGWAFAHRKVGRYVSSDSAYADWRGYGPGALLPGGSAAADAIRERDDNLARAQASVTPLAPLAAAHACSLIKQAVCDPSGQHRYLSTHCLHLNHDECKTTCKHCPARCVCDCHDIRKAA